VGGDGRRAGGVRRAEGRGADRHGPRDGYKAAGCSCADRVRSLLGDLRAEGERAGADGGIQEQGAGANLASSRSSGGCCAAAASWVTLRRMSLKLCSLPFLVV
jgi:hypothetical protein